jgi:Lipopolysaccharide-assembly
MRFALSFLAAMLCVACSGYQLGPVKPTKLKSVQRICVKNFTNETLEPRMEVALAGAVIKQLQNDGTYEITDESRADAILQGALTQIGRTPARVVRGNVLQTSEYLLTITCNYRLTSAHGGNVLDSGTVTGTTNFFVSAGLPAQSIISADTVQDQRQAMPLAVDNLATRLAGQLSEGW